MLDNGATPSLQIVVSALHEGQIAVDIADGNNKWPICMILHASKDAISKHFVALAKIAMRVPVQIG